MGGVARALGPAGPGGTGPGPFPAADDSDGPVPAADAAQIRMRTPLRCLRRWRG